MEAVVGSVLNIASAINFQASYYSGLTSLNYFDTKTSNCVLKRSLGQSNKQMIEKSPEQFWDLFFDPPGIFFNEGFPALVSATTLYPAFMEVMAKSDGKGIGSIQ